MSKKFTLRDLPKEERPRERLIRLGEQSLSAQELLQIILGRGVKDESVALIAQRLLSHFGNLQKIAEASIEELCSIKGIGPAKAVQIKAAFELGRRLFTQVSEYKSKELLNPQNVYKLMKVKLKNYHKEHFYIVALNARNYSVAEISIGTLDSSLVHPREVFLEAIRNKAKSVIFVHNHPSGNPEPSRDDILLTKRLISAGKILGIKVLDHIIVTENKYFSFKEKGLIK